MKQGILPLIPSGAPGIDGFHREHRAGGGEAVSAQRQYRVLRPYRGPRAGVLCALPALAANGLFDHLAPLDAPREGGFYYRLLHVFSLLALMALLRVKTVEALRRGCPGAQPRVEEP